MLNQELRVLAPPSGSNCESSNSACSSKCRHATGQGMQKNPLRVVGVAELPALPGINLSLKRTKVGAHFTATFPSQRRTSACLGDGRKAPSPKQTNYCTVRGSVSASAGRVLTGIFKNIIMLSLGTKKREVSPRADRCAEELPQVKGFISYISGAFCMTTP